MATAAEAVAMRRAVALAARGLGFTSPNPVVGCVVLDATGDSVGEGYHQRAGGPHAEVHALRAAGEKARGGTAVVTLEPCNHTGRTGPCAQALLDAGIARVVYAVADPTPDATGGAATLRAAGVDVESGLLAEEAQTVNAAWLTSVRTGRPHVTWKYAATLDGRVAAADGTSRWISSAESRADVHRLRAECDAVVVGSGTQRADDPHLAVRGPLLTDGAAQPLRVVVDTHGTAVRPGARVLDDAAPTLVAVAEGVEPLPGVETVHLPYADEHADADHLPYVERVPRAAGNGAVAPPPSGRPDADDEEGRLEHRFTASGGAYRAQRPDAPATRPGQSGTPGTPGGLDIDALLAELHARGVRSVLLEGGPTLAGAFVAAGAVDRVIGYLAPTLLGAGPAALTGGGITTLTEALRLDVRECVALGPDLRITATVAGPGTKEH
ncbi:bifunctional diaminohydroxyphosphoribosylaminopyrimidine deaminase/5-amino-6-(5-phosphoribosylamino)uracil reductase RibD [Streptomyces flavofungini]|uniref:bifunctional diaminohydroxyphosphoribosylaminopyrimidine deaminase/5-amino-6-(5-phosphoribosylamino)uracil reductase RibD n=1 Tax=Streptomyces flavofungini TaxID=68200 RepID=UPI0025AFD309|nr:bifunctional diaminohydroxyphosphoribosylaminopyrimidine deaminase/5-amino-6-(5-phosphoribosylamino)uracil reductase RibD [Streptomyces flavofungini]WJV50080.1 bifunctional diaminohydroxyphosphoribosylaminopyrimidine deaminase/5-amino-6-(5-phosphoribosylamino)uracil reductase RibD [Streptomyces flavofungini]